MILAGNGQNVYPEEIEVILNELPYVAESIVLQRDTKIIALIVPNMDALDKAGLNADALEAIMKQNISLLNSKLPAYSTVNGYELRFEPFAKTPKGSIRRIIFFTIGGTRAFGLIESMAEELKPLFPGFQGIDCFQKICRRFDAEERAALLK